MITDSFGRYMAETAHDHEVNLARLRFSLKPLMPLRS